MENLDTLRVKIDEIDKKMMTLFEERMDISKKVGEYKIKNNLPVLNAKREEIVIENSVRNLNNKDMAKYAKQFVKDVMKISREYQEDILKNN